MSKTIKDIKEEFDKLQIEQSKEIKALINQYQTDSRAGVTKIVKRYEKLLKDRQDEIERIRQMKFFEEKYKDYTYICGIDEVGRGPLAGPVMTAAVILPKDCDILYLNDSKKLSEKMRESLFDEILQKALAYSVASVSPQRIDEINILRATFEAMKESVYNLDIEPNLALVDAETIPDLGIKQVSIVKGDSRSISIAAASIVAKVTRDRLMMTYDKLYPVYNFASNKGYGSKEHIEAIKKYGPCPLHRRSFLKNLI